VATLHSADNGREGDFAPLQREVPMKMRHAAWLIDLASLVAALASGTAAPPASPPGGMFVIGDVSAVGGAPVTFWGAQWWKDNALTGGSAPPSFKGFASGVAPNCLGFTTDPGNSVPPPDGPLPATIDVLVASTVQKSGEVISGTVVNIARVRVDPGYDSNPGHAGTGTVIALLGCPNE
jgi:hypothetical protein